MDSKQKTHSTGKDEISHEIARLNKAMTRVDDLAFKIHRCPPGSHALTIATFTWRRVTFLLVKLGVQDIPHWPSQDNICDYWDFLHDLREKAVRRLRYQRLKKWKDRIAASAMSSSSDIFKFLKRKHDLPQHHVTTNAEGKPFYIFYRPMEAVE